MSDSREGPAPPRLIPALVTGFDAITNHILVILFPIGFDLIIWFAPHLRLKGIIEDLVDDMVQLSSYESAELTGMIEVGKETWLQIGDQLNLMLTLRSIPVGVPSLMASSLPLETPFGTPVFLEIPSFLFAFIIIILLTVFGLIIGTLYYQLISGFALGCDFSFQKTLRNWPRSSFRVLVLAFIWVVVFVLVSIPASCLVSLASFAGFSMGQLGILLYGGFLIWLIFPLLFSAHGIFVNNLSVWPSIRTGIRITNLTLPTTVLFFLSVFLLTQGLDIIWRIPPADSWLTLLGIVAHAFVVSGLLSASFIYYRDADRWVTALSNQTQRSDPAEHQV